MLAAKAAWEVTAGVIPGVPMPEFTKRWGYTSEDRERDRTNPNGPVLFNERRDAAYEYARQLNDPAILNWVRVDWIYF